MTFYPQMGYCGETEVKCCPFCGKKPSIVGQQYESCLFQGEGKPDINSIEECWTIWCQLCGAKFGGSTAEKAIEIWNDRKGDD